MTDFNTFELSESLSKAIEELGFQSATAIQKKAIPNLLHQERDFIGLAHTGTGKTAAFGIPLIENMQLEQRFVQGLIIAPTRELVKQIDQQISLLAKYTKGLRILSVYGGTSIQAQIKDFKRAPHILIATPGRLLDLINRRVVVLKDVSCIVLDEADEMLNMGFKEDIDIILSTIKSKHNTWLFSATFPKEIRRISQEYMNDPLEFAVDSVKVTNADISHEYCQVKGAKKIDILKRILDANPELRGIVFCRTKKGTQSLSDDLSTSSYKVDALHGDLSQAQRERVMKKFRNYQIQVLVATDVAARGIDVKDLSHIIHFDIPDDLSYYTHRSGRTARAGKKGVSVVFVPPSQQRRIKYLERMLKINFKQVSVPTDAEIMKFRMSKWATELAQVKELEKVDEDMLGDLYKILNNFTKEELMEKMVTRELRKLNYHELKEPKESKSQSPQSYNNVDSRSKRKKGKTNNKAELKDDSSDVNFFINVGFIDGIGKRDLLTYLSEQCGLDMSQFRNLQLNKKHAFFDAPKKFEGKIISSFKNIKIANRKLRVNRNQN